MSLILHDSPEILSFKFRNLNEPKDVAELLNVKYGDLIYYLYRLDMRSQYKTFEIPKKNGSFREINAPISPLKILQRKLNQVLVSIYKPRDATHGFVKGKSILTNSKLHIKRKYVLNIDLEDFFGSINFGRVRGLFLNKPYGLPPKIATLIAQLCCFDGKLPQGAPTSPIITNLICARLDRSLTYLAFNHKCIYSRYADDITFSTSINNFPKALARLKTDNKEIELGEDLRSIIESNGFKVNYQKVRLQVRTQRQEVTGLVVNKFPNVKRKFVRQIRSMFHSWEKFGLDSAQTEYESKYSNFFNPFGLYPDFRNVLCGKLEFLGYIKGKGDTSFVSFVNKLNHLDSILAKRFMKFLDDSKELVIPLIYTEGKTDAIHLKAALKALKLGNLHNDVVVEFDGNDKEMGGPELKKLCDTVSKTKANLQPLIFIFDRDDNSVLKDIESEEGKYKNWGNNVYSFAIPIPEHRKDTPEVCIEMYYTDDEIKRKDDLGRRLFFNTEFDQKSGRNKYEADLSCHEMKKIKNSKLSIIDNSVFDSKSVNLALSKYAFAENVMNRKSGFKDFDFTEFSKIFKVIEEIIRK